MGGFALGIAEFTSEMFCLYNWEVALCLEIVDWLICNWSSWCMVQLGVFQLVDPAQYCMGLKACIRTPQKGHQCYPLFAALLSFTSVTVARLLRWLVLGMGGMHCRKACAVHVIVCFIAMAGQQ